MSLLSEKHLDKTAFSVVSFTDKDDVRAYWHSRTPEERLEAMEWMRQVTYGYDPATQRLQRVLTVSALSTGVRSEAT